MRTQAFKLRGCATASLLGLSLVLGQAHAQEDMPGKGVSVQPVHSSLAEEAFQTLLISRALEALGYDVRPPQQTEYVTAYTAIANGDASFLAINWIPLHNNFYEKSGGDTRFYREGTYVTNSLQGYLIDKKTAEAHNISNLEQLKQPEIARLFDTNGDGKADLTGCNPGWGCEAVIEHHIKAYDLGKTVSHNQGTYSALMADTIARYRQGQPILYYTWTPYWISGVLRPGQEVVFLQVPFTSLPDDQKEFDTKLPDGSNYGFPVNSQHIVANRDFAEANPAAARLFAIMKLPIADINAQNMRMEEGERSTADINRHVDGWIKAHQDTFDSWLKQAREAAI